ncbi:glutamate--tRNA ligase, chloroplastic/mitochondrial isoform X1 [Phalaenopsis equestris]|uniref:glutamate--tRNA ligase, chloroplastic/mitochondrial isoform X1 n=1 Tax=Phalaenopsis equestris TaxID=78828 RepID=UPI0009E47BDD|nr:glutamate--tRNA ligase, chloroplastic/mitochondrial isoform X1 [Phalaenopsis equestris]
MAMAGLGGSPWLRIRVLHELPTFSFRQCFLFGPGLSLCRRNFSVSASATASPRNSEVRVRFAPSPTGNLHVGGARTALFNYLFARSNGGKFVLRIEDTDLERSRKESEEAMLNDLMWLGLDWDEGPGVGGDYGPYRQSERNLLYKQYAENLLNSGHVYRCFCSNEELEKMKERAQQLQLPPIYTGKWATASDIEIQEELAKRTPYTYRFRVPKEGTLKINDLIRGEVSWSLDTLGDFVILRSNGQPVYNFCVTVDDAAMRISHVIRAEEHLPNTLRQALIYQALGFTMPSFAHVSLILAPDRSKLSKRHGATSVGQFREMGYLPKAMVNYLALLGWGDGTDNEFFTMDQLVEKFSISRVNKSGAVFDSTKLRWMNGQHLRALPSEELTQILGERWKSMGLLIDLEGIFVKEATELLKDGIDLVTDADTALSNLLSYPLESTLASAECKPIVEDNLFDLATSLLSAYDSGDLLEALKDGPAGWQKWVKNFGKQLKRKGKSLFMPLRLLLTGKLHGPEMGGSISLIYKAGICGAISRQAGFITLEERFQVLREIDWDAFDFEKKQSGADSVATVSY